MELEHIHLRCEDLEKSLDWWRRVMGARDLGRMEGGAAPIVRLGVAGCVLAFSPAPPAVDIDHPATAPHWGVYQLGILVEDLAAAMAEITARGGAFRGPLARPNGLTIAFLQAPDGVELEFMCYEADSRA